MVHNGYRLASFIALVELAWVVAEEYLVRFDVFPLNGHCSSEFVDRVKQLFNELYHDQIFNNASFIIVKDIVLRALNVVMGNIEQYKLLMFLPNRQSCSAGSTLLVHQSQLPRKKIKTIEDTERYTKLMIERVLLFNSLLFTATTLHLDSFIKHQSSFLSTALKILIENGLLFQIKNGIRGVRKSTPVYFKQLPDVHSSVSVANFITQLATFGNDRLTLESIEERSKRIVIKAQGSINQCVFDYLHSTRYAHLALDSSCLTKVSSTNGKQMYLLVARYR